MSLHAGEAPPYTIPYQNLVPNDPSFDDMKKVVVTERVRPPLDPNWKNDEVSEGSRGEPLNKGLSIVTILLLPLRRGQPLNKGQAAPSSHSDNIS